MNYNRNHFLNVSIVVMSFLIFGILLIGKAHSVSASATESISAEQVRNETINSFKQIQVQGISGDSNASEADWTFTNLNKTSVRVNWSIKTRGQSKSGTTVVPANDSIIFTSIPGRMTYTTEIAYVANNEVRFVEVGEQEVLRSIAPLNLTLLDRSNIRIPNYPRTQIKSEVIPKIFPSIQETQPIMEPAPSCPGALEQVDEQTKPKDDESKERRLIALNR